MSDDRLIAIIRALQETYGNSLGYRKMADRIKDDYGIVLGRKKVLRLMECFHCFQKGYKTAVCR